ncbi:MAG: YdcF family protein [Bacteroidetes bacterium]|nr:MAG: YdcF family protein [Bacteroidota bacterium]
MFFILSKALLFLISPFFWIVVGTIVLFRSKSMKRRRRLSIALVVSFIFFSNTAIFLEFMRIWEVPGIKIEKTEPHEVGVILGGMFEYDSQLDRLSIRRGGDRLFQAFSLYKQGKIKQFLISGDNGFVSSRSLHEAKQTKEVLMKWGVPDSVITTEERSKNTHENAKNTAEILKNKNLTKNVLLITSGIHMRRAKACFDKEGIQTTPFSTDLYTGKKRGYHWDQLFVPNPYNFILWNELLKEIVGYVTYDVVGYI